jgi:hypothetical protein
MIKNKIVIRYQNGNLSKGYINNFQPKKPAFHISLIDAPPGTQPLEVQVSDLKAIFFVKDFSGNSEYQEFKEFKADKIYRGRKIIVAFKDGEVLVGTTKDYDPSRSYFFVVPADKDSNNRRCYVVTSATEVISFI